MAATIGDNSKNLTESEQRVLFMYHFNEIRKQREIVTAAKKIEKTLRREAKAKGIILSDIDFGLRANAVDDDMIIVDELSRRLMIAKFLNFPVGTQTAFDFEADTKTKRAAREGTTAALLNEEPKSSYSPGSREDQAFLKAHHATREEMAADLAAANAKMAAANGDDSGGPDADFDEGSADDQ